MIMSREDMKVIWQRAMDRQFYRASVYAPQCTQRPWSG
jgi:hypothetical protein